MSTTNPAAASAEAGSAASILANLSSFQETQPAAALAAADAFRAELTGPLLEAVERGVADQKQAFEREAFLFNYAVYLLAKWREPKAFPLFLRWFGLPGEDALELGGDSVVQDGARLLASVCAGQDLQPLLALILNTNAYPLCRGQGIKALGVLCAWGELPRPTLEGHLQFLAREGLERRASLVWNLFARTCVDLEALTVFPELRRADEEGLINRSLFRQEELERIERGPRDPAHEVYAVRYPPITDVVEATRWWAGFQRPQAAEVEAQPTGERLVGEPGQTYLAGVKVGRNELCPCGSGRKFKACCGK